MKTHWAPDRYSPSDPYSARTPAWLATASAAGLMLLLLATAAGVAGGRVCLSNMRINNASPIIIPCGGSVNLDCSVDYEIDNSHFNWGNCWAVDAPVNMTAQIYDNDGIWGHEWYSSWMVAIPGSPSSGTVNFTIPINCTSAPECEDCLVQGDENEAEIFLAFWNELNGPGSPAKTARCVCGSCVHRTSIGDGGGVRGTIATFDWNTDAAFQGVTGFTGGIRFNPASYQFTSLTFSDPFVQAHTQVFPLPDGVAFQAHFPAPHDFPVGAFGQLDLAVLSGAPLAESWIAFDPQTTFLDQVGQPIVCCMVDGVGRVLPDNQVPPQFNLPLIHFDECTLEGRPGSLSSPFLGVVQNYVTLEAYLGGDQLGVRDVQTDGSFRFPGLVLPSGAVIQLIAHDQNGNMNQTQLGPAGGCAAAVEEPVVTGSDLRFTPNPIRDHAQVMFFLPDGGDVMLDILDAAGRSVRRMELPGLRPGVQELSWNGRDEGGEPLPSGIYYYRVRTSGRVLRGSLAIVR